MTEELHTNDMILKHHETLTKLSEQVLASCRKIDALEKFLLEKITQRDEEIKTAKLEMDRRMEKLDELYVKVMSLEKESLQNKGSRKWEEHIISALIGLAVIVVVWIMTHGIK